MERGINKEELLKLTGKIEMYLQEEIKLQNSIKNILEEMLVNLNDNNSKTLKSRLEILYLDFDISISNKRKYIELILNVIKSYELFADNINEKLQ